MAIIVASKAEPNARKLAETMAKAIRAQEMGGAAVRGEDGAGRESGCNP